MAISFVDQVLSYLAAGANRNPFIAAIGLAAFAGTSFTRRYGQDVFVVDNVTLGAPNQFRLETPVQDDARVTGTREQRGERPQRQWFDLRLRPAQLDWIDVSFAAPAQFALHAVPGSLVLGPGADVEQQGADVPPPPQNQRLKMRLGVNTDAFTLNYTLQVHVWLAEDVSPAADLRRIQQARRYLEGQPDFLASLDGPPDQRPYLFVQVYPSGLDNLGPLTEPAITQLFDAADVLAAFFALP